jgi:hypothetical protein
LKEKPKGWCIIDACNVAYAHGKGKFSTKGT